jgi:hypothetical protein
MEEGHLPSRGAGTGAAAEDLGPGAGRALESAGEVARPDGQVVETLPSPGDVAGDRRVIAQGLE